MYECTWNRKPSVKLQEILKKPYKPVIELSNLIALEIPEGQTSNQPRLSKKDLLCLSKVQMINDLVIIRYAKYLIDNANRSVGFTDTFFMTKLMQNPPNYEPAKKSESVPSFLEGKYDIFFIPFSRKGHWSLLSVKYKERVIEVHDSLGKKCGKISKSLKYFLINCGLKPFRIECHSKKRQKNVHDCGIFVCRYMEAIINNEDPSTILQKEITSYRKKILQRLSDLVGTKI